MLLSTSLRCPELTCSVAPQASTKEYLAHARRFDDMIAGSFPRVRGAIPGTDIGPDVIADAVSSLQGGIELKRPGLEWNERRRAMRDGRD